MKSNLQHEVYRGKSTLYIEPTLIPLVRSSSFNEHTNRTDRTHTRCAETTACLVPQRRACTEGVEDERTVNTQSIHNQQSHRLNNEHKARVCLHKKFSPKFHCFIEISLMIAYITKLIYNHMFAQHGPYNETLST